MCIIIVHRFACGSVALFEVLNIKNSLCICKVDSDHCV